MYIVNQTKDKIVKLEKVEKRFEQIPIGSWKTYLELKEAVGDVIPPEVSENDKYIEKECIYVNDELFGKYDNMVGGAVMNDLIIALKEGKEFYELQREVK